MLTLFEHSEKRFVEQFKITASLHGYKIDDDVESETGSSHEQKQSGAPVIRIHSVTCPWKKGRG